MFNTEPLKIIPGGLNLLAPGDQVAEGDCLDLAGWWPEDAGKLQQGRGYVIKSNGYSHAVDTILDADGRFYFAGAGSLSRFGTGVLGTGWGSDPIGAISYRGWGWFTSANLQKRDNGTNYVDWAVETPGSAPTESDSNSGELLDGDYEYYVTFLNGDYFEGNPSPQLAFNLSAGDNNDVTITRPSATSAEIAYWNVYRHGPGLAAPYKVNLDPIAIATTTFHDDGSVGNSLDNESLIARDEVMEADHDAPPAAKVIANKLFNGRIVVANSAAHPNRLWYTPALRPNFFRGSDNPQNGDWVDVGDDSGDEILFVAIHPSRAIVYRRKSVWQVVNDFDDDGSRIEPLIPDIGTVGFRAVASSSLGDYFAANDGIYRVADGADKRSVKIDPVFSGVTTSTLKVAASYRNKIAVGINEGRVWVSIPVGPSTTNNYSFIYHVRTDRWYTKSLGISCFTRGQTEFLGGFGEKVASLEDGVADDGGGVPVRYQSAYQDAGFPDREKTWGDLVLTHQTGGEDLTITVYTNKRQDLTGADAITLATINSASLTREVVPLIYPDTYLVAGKRGKPIRSFNISVAISGTGPAQLFGVLIESPIFLHYYVEARKGKTFDTGPTDHGTPMVKSIDQVEIDLDAPQNASLQIQSDLPGSAGLMNRVNVAISATTGRQVVTLVLPSVVSGKLLRHQVTSDTDFHVYGFRVRSLPIGVYLDGAVGDSWDTEPLAIAG
jgi:hypothetical protein